MSSYIFGFKPGDEVTISGPFSEFFAPKTMKEIIFGGVGAGMAPVRWAQTQNYLNVFM